MIKKVVKYILLIVAFTQNHRRALATCKFSKHFVK